MAQATEIKLPLGQDGLYKELEHDPNVNNYRALTNAPEGALKHAFNVDYQSGINLKRRLGYHYLFHQPELGELNYSLHKVFDGTAALATDYDWGDLCVDTHGIRGLDRYVYLDNKAQKGNFNYDLQRYTMFASRTDILGTAGDFPATHTFHWRNPATANIRMLGAPVLDRLVWDFVEPNAFSDVNVAGMQPARFWNYATVSSLGEQETFLVGTYGGHYTRPGAVQAPQAWNTIAYPAPPPPTPLDPPTGSFDTPYIDPNCYQRRCLVWFPDWYQRWSAANGYTVPPDENNDIGTYSWYAPFIWYYKDNSPDGPDDFYAEPCGRFLEVYNGSLFMSRIERTELVGNTKESDTWTAGVPTWRYEPSGIMWSFWGLNSALQFGTSTMPPEYPFRVPDEPRERVWGCAAYGYPCNRIAYFRPGYSVITGMKTWNNSLYIMKPNGFMAVNGSWSGNFSFTDLQMSQGPCGERAWCVTEEGIYYVTKRGLFLFDGNPASQNRCLSDMKVQEIFENDIDWLNSTNFLEGEVFGISLEYDRTNSQIIISYPKVGEQGGGGRTDLPVGTPTRQLVYDTKMSRFTEWAYRLPIDHDATGTPSIGLMLTGKSPTDDDFVVGTHPIGNALGNNVNGNLLFRINSGYRDNVQLLDTGEPDPDTGELIPYNVTTKDHYFDTFRPKQSIVRMRSVIYANDGHMKKRVTYNYYNEVEEAPIDFNALNEDGYYRHSVMTNRTRTAQSVSGAINFSCVSFTFYHDDTDMDDTDNTNIGDYPIEFVGLSVEVQPATNDVG